MKSYFRRILSCTLVTAFLLCTVPLDASAAAFSDVPADSWAARDIERCVELGLFQGETSTRFGMGHQMIRAAFAVVLCRLFRWEPVTPQEGTYQDVQDPASWYFSAVETAYAHGAITRQTGTFRPGDPITRGEMAVMLVRALGYGTIAGLAQELPMPFTDVETGAGYISMAYELGIVSGTSANTFSPDRTATREQAAVMLMRLYDKYYAPAGGLVGLATGKDSGDWSGFEAVALTGGRLSYGSSVQLTRPAQEREEAFFAAAGAAGAKALLHVTGVSSALRGPAADAAGAIAAAAEAGGYDGVYLDFPELGEDRRTALTALTAALKEDLGEKLLYVAALAPAWQEERAGAYDYAALCASADRLVLRVAAYEKEAEGFVTAPLEPLEEVYYALAELKGAVPAKKLALLLTTTGSGWKDGRRESRVDAEEIARLLEDQQDTECYYSNRYACAYLICKGERSSTAVWYLDGRGARERARMCGFFGVNQICLSDLDSVSTDLLSGLQ